MGLRVCVAVELEEKLFQKYLNGRGSCTILLEND
jgi:hypothetical protein